MKLLFTAPPKPPEPKATFLGALKNIGSGLYERTAKFANYRAASPTATTHVGGRIGSNNNSTFGSIQRVGMNWTAEDVAKNSCIGWAYLMTRIGYCSATMTYVPSTGDKGLDKEIKAYLHGADGQGGAFAAMGVDCSMQDAFSRTADIETPVRGDAGLIVWRDESESIRLIEFSADQLGEVYGFSPPRAAAIAYNSTGDLVEMAGGIDCIYFAGRYFKGADCIAYKIYERTNSWYGSPRIYSAADVIYFADPANFRGIRGVTKFATAIQHMEKGETLFQTGMDAALRQAKTAMVVMNERGMPDEATYETDTDTDGRVTYAERIPGGPLTEYFYNGDSANFTSPDSPGPELIQGVETSDERVALALGLPYSFLINATKIGGAPSRLEVNKASREFARIQNRIHRPRLHRIRDIVLMDALRRNLIQKPFGMPREQFLKGWWQLPISPTVDAGYSNDENIKNLRAGLESPQALVAEVNRDWSDVLNEKSDAAIAVAVATQDSNRTLKKMKSPVDGMPYDGTITALDIAQLSDNPQQSAAAENLIEGKTATGVQPTQKAA